MSENSTAQNNNTVPAQLIENLAKCIFADREADRVLVRDMFGQMVGLGVAALELARSEARERADERQRNERLARRS
jgi:hypothetical protein